MCIADFSMASELEKIELMFDRRPAEAKPLPLATTPPLPAADHPLDRAVASTSHRMETQS